MTFMAALTSGIEPTTDCVSGGICLQRMGKSRFMFRKSNFGRWAGLAWLPSISIHEMANIMNSPLTIVISQWDAGAREIYSRSIRSPYILWNLRNLWTMIPGNADPWKRFDPPIPERRRQAVDHTAKVGTTPGERVRCTHGRVLLTAAARHSSINN